MGKSIQRYLSILLIAVMMGAVSFASAPLAAAAATEATEADRLAIERVIRAQLAAFQDDDAAGAFACAAPGLRAKYGSADVFLHVVRHGYAPLYRISQAVFGPLVMTHQGPVQKVRVVAADGRPFTAMYLLQRQPDRTWAIAGVMVTAVGDREA